MNRRDFIALLRSLVDDGIEVCEQVEMEDPPGTPLVDEYGNRVINDVVIVGDGRLYIERDGNEGESEQAVVTLLAEFDTWAGALIDALEAIDARDAE